MSIRPSDEELEGGRRSIGHERGIWSDGLAIFELTSLLNRILWKALNMIGRKR